MQKKAATAGSSRKILALFEPLSGPSNAHIQQLQNIDTDQIIPAEYLTLVPSKVGRRAGCV